MFLPGPRRLTGALLTLLGLLVASHPASAQDRDRMVPLTQFPRERIAIETRSIRRELFEAWRAESPQARAQGLMFVEEAAMRPDQAMIFVYDPPEIVGMWMKNTLLPLDMLFVDERGCVVTIKERAQPGSLATISSRVPVALVVELKAGSVARHQVRLGDRVVRVDAGWPTDTAQSCTSSPSKPNGS